MTNAKENLTWPAQIGGFYWDGEGDMWNHLLFVPAEKLAKQKEQQAARGERMLARAYETIAMVEAGKTNEEIAEHYGFDAVNAPTVLKNMRKRIADHEAGQAA